MWITNAATGNPNVKALVYVAAFAPDLGDTVESLGKLGTDGGLGPATLDLRPYPAPPGYPPLEGYIKLDVFRDIFAADLPRKQAHTMALSQRPGALATLGEPSGPPARRPGRRSRRGTSCPNATAPSAPTCCSRVAERIDPRKTVEVRGASHVMISRPNITTDLIIKAARSGR